jgi:hypothetical protein
MKLLLQLVICALQLAAINLPGYRDSKYLKEITGKFQGPINLFTGLGLQRLNVEALAATALIFNIGIFKLKTLV